MSTVQGWLDRVPGGVITHNRIANAMQSEIDELRADLFRKEMLLQECSTCLAHLDSVSPSPLGEARKLMKEITKELAP